jgi:hypothetical protein
LKVIEAEWKGHHLLKVACICSAQPGVAVPQMPRPTTSQNA